MYSDEWRTAQPDPITKVKMPTNLTPTGKVRKPRLKKNNVASANAQMLTETDVKPQIDGKLTKRKRSKSDKVCKKKCCLRQIFECECANNNCLSFLITRKRIQTHQNDQQIHSFSFAKNKDQF